MDLKGLYIFHARNMPMNSVSANFRVWKLSLSSPHNYRLVIHTHFGINWSWCNAAFNNLLKRGGRPTYYIMLKSLGSLKEKMHLKSNENASMSVFFDLEFFCLIGVCVRKLRVIASSWSTVPTVSCTKSWGTGRRSHLLWSWTGPSR